MLLERVRAEKAKRAARQRLREDFPHYARTCLFIRTKEGGINALELNQPQLYIHERLEAQRRETGKVRAVILKGRQQGCSTYTEARYYHKVTNEKGRRAYILTHEDSATTNLFDMAKMYHDNCPDDVRPSTGAANAKELLFDELSSGYKVGTAGSRGTGRGSTIHYFHGSEVAFWPNADTHVAGVLQAVPDLPGTEIILESTSNGPQGVFYEIAMAAQRGEGEYQLIFVPWFWSREYRKKTAPGFALNSEEERYKEIHGLDDEQMAWRRAKIVELGGAHHFRREYPATVEEAFKAAAVGALWTQEILDSSRVPEMPKDAAGVPLDMVRVVVAVDPSGGGGPDNDEVGIVVAGRATNGHAYVWLDDSGSYSAETWATKALALYESERADAVVAEKNFGGDLVETNIRVKAREMRQAVNIKPVNASRGKQQRAEPVAALYERGMAHHVGRLVALEDEQTTWVPGVSRWSPGRLDAAVWALTELMLQDDGGDWASSSFDAVPSGGAGW